ncbi:MAG TPA: prepilin-type N-terminal cleavage/methylation domain-containing protein [Candidatus Acidoferrum sp.]|nr:prepilin-type N-terminal cleavage/methylation domain-containing protein [Candidatus Acidoferrum sp.]
MRRTRKNIQARRKESGFSLIELLIVVAVILVVAAIAIPSMTHAKMSANEAAAASALRTLATEEVNYDAAWSSGFSPTLGALGPPPPGNAPSPANADMVDAVLASGIRGGYQFIYMPVIPSGGTGVATGYQVNANPISPGITGEWFYFMDQTNCIRHNYGSPADQNSPPIPK